MPLFQLAVSPRRSVGLRICVLLTALTAAAASSATVRGLLGADPAEATSETQLAHSPSPGDPSLPALPHDNPQLRQVLDEILALRERRGTILAGTMLEQLPAAESLGAAEHVSAEHVSAEQARQTPPGPECRGSSRPDSPPEEGPDFARILQRVAEREGLTPALPAPRQLPQAAETGWQQHLASVLDRGRSRPFELPPLPTARSRTDDVTDDELAETLARTIRQLEERARQLDNDRRYQRADRLRRLATRIRDESRRLARP